MKRGFWKKDLNEKKRLTKDISTQTVLDAVDVPVMVVNRSLDLILANKAARLLSEDGQSASTCFQLLGQKGSCQEPVENCPVHQCFATGDTILTSHSYLDQQNREVLMNVTAKPLFNQRGEVAWVVKTFHDITAEQYNLSRQRLQESFLQTLINVSPAMIYYKDIKGNYQGCNPSFAEQILGCRQEQVIGKCSSDFSHRFPPEFLEMYRRKDCELIEQGCGVQYYEGQVTCSDGQLREFLFYKALYPDQEGKPAGIIGVMQDITTLKQSQKALRVGEQRLRQILDSLQAGVMVIDAKTHNILDVNDWACRIIGLEREIIVGQICHEFVCPALRNACPVTDKKELIRGEERTLINSQGCDIPILKSVQPINLGGRDVLIESFLDIREHKRIEQEVQQLRKMEAVGRLASGIAHEINSPLQYIGDNTRYLRDSFQRLMALIMELRKLLDVCQDEELVCAIKKQSNHIDLNYLREEIPTAIEQTLEGIEQVNQIVRAMRDFAHPGANVRQNVDINKSVQTTVTIARNYWKQHADVTLDLDDSLPKVNCFATELNQVLLNLLTNATDAIVEKYTYIDKTIRGIIAIKTCQGAKNQVEIHISDNGCGIKPEVREHIFEPFFTTKDVGKGTGQGLAVAHSIMVDKHGGKILVESEPGEGTTFILRLPINALAEAGENSLTEIPAKS